MAFYLIAIPLIPIALAIVLLCLASWKPKNGSPLPLFAMGLAFIATILATHQSGLMQFPDDSKVTQLMYSPENLGWLRISLPEIRWDALSAVWIGTLLISGLSHFWLQRNQSRTQSAVQLIVIGFLIWGVVLNDLRWQAGAFWLSGWAMLMSLRSRDQTSGVRLVPFSSMVLGGLLVSDLLWFMAIVSTASVVPVSSVADLLTPEFLSLLGPYERAVVSIAAVIGAFSIAIRCGLFPLAHWSFKATQFAKSTSIFLITTIGSGMYLLLRFVPFLGQVSEARSLLFGLGLLSALLLPLTALRSRPYSTRIARVITGLIAIACVGIGTYPAGVMTMTQLVIMGLLLCSAVVAVRDHQQIPTWFKWVSYIAIASGLYGQEWVFNALRYSNGQQEQVAVPFMAIIVFVVAHSIICIQWVDIAFRRSETDHGTQAIFAINHWPFIVITIALGLTLLTPMYLSQNWANLPRPGLLSVVGLLSYAVWVPFFSRASEDEKQSTQLSAIVDLGLNDFHMPLITNVFVIMPTALYSAIVHFIDFVIIERFIFPELRIQAIATGQMAETQEAESTPGWSAAISIITAVFLTIAILYAANAK